MTYEPSLHLQPSLHPYSYVIQMWVLGNRHVFMMVVASQDHTIAICDFPPHILQATSNLGSQIHLLTELHELLNNWLSMCNRYMHIGELELCKVVHQYMVVSLNFTPAYKYIPAYFFKNHLWSPCWTSTMRTYSHREKNGWQCTLILM